MNYPFVVHIGSTFTIGPIQGGGAALLRVTIDPPSDAKQHDWEFVVIHTTNEIVVQSDSLYFGPGDDLSEFNSDVIEESEWSGEVQISCIVGPEDNYTSSCRVEGFGYKQRVDLPDIA